MIKVTLSQSMCLYQLALVMGCSVMCGFLDVVAGDVDVAVVGLEAGEGILN